MAGVNVPDLDHVARQGLHAQMVVTPLVSIVNNLLDRFRIVVRHGPFHLGKQVAQICTNRNVIVPRLQSRVKVVDVRRLYLDDNR